jgi:hypothetical protein
MVNILPNSVNILWEIGDMKIYFGLVYPKYHQPQSPDEQPG